LMSKLSDTVWAFTANNGAKTYQGTITGATWTPTCTSYNVSYQTTTPSSFAADTIYLIKE
jgi:hypothetical protein